MKLYYHPISTTSRMVVLFSKEENIELDLEIVNLLTGDQKKPDYVKINPNSLVPVLEEGDFVLTESSAILKYLADKVNSPAYPKDLKKRARVHEMMDWFNSNLYKNMGYEVVYPQIYPHHQRPNDEAQKGTIHWGGEKNKNWLKILDSHFIGPKNNYLCGDEITLSDYFGIQIILIGNLVGYDYSDYPNISRWIKNMQMLQSWPEVHQAFDNFATSLSQKEFAKI